MNDLRSRSRALAAVPDEGSAPTSTPPRVRPETEEQSGRRMSRRQSIAERARRLDDEGAAAGTGQARSGFSDDQRFKSSRPRVDEDLTAADPGPAAEAEAGPEGPSSRPSRRRDVAEEGEETEDRFPWHFQFDDDEPDELHASSPLLSRAFRSSIG